jgi:hypothetical protein
MDYRFIDGWFWLLALCRCDDQKERSEYNKYPAQIQHAGTRDLASTRFQRWKSNGEWRGLQRLSNDKAGAKNAAEAAQISEPNVTNIVDATILIHFLG